MKIDVQPQPPESAWISGENLVWHYAKSCSDDPAGTRAYWEPNIPHAELWFMLHRQADGSWIHNHMLIPESCAWCGGATNITDDVATPNGTYAISYCSRNFRRSHYALHPLDRQLEDDVGFGDGWASAPCRLLAYQVLR